jgi:Ca2+-binding RTX toxin-like protein
VTGSDGNDVIDGGADSDYLSGGSGDDTFRASLGDDTVLGGSGSDLIDFVGLSGGVTVNLATRAATLPDLDSSLTFANIERLSGTASADAFTGDARRNVFVGLAGNDVLDGGSGNDTLGGGVGKDTLTGGAGNDVFDFDAITDSTVAGSGRDIVADFSAGDLINLASIDAVAGGANDAFAFINGAAFSALGQVRVFQQNGKTFVDMNTTGSLDADMRIELTGLLTLNAADFVL